MKKITVRDLIKFLQTKRQTESVYLTESSIFMKNENGFISEPISRDYDNYEKKILSTPQKKKKKIKNNNILKNQMLCDFNKGKYKRIKSQKLKSLVDDFNSLIKLLGVIYGEYTNKPDSSLSCVTHSIGYLKLKDRKIYADITIYNTHYGKKLKEYIDEYGVDQLKYSIRMDSKKIYTFDIL